MRGLSANRPLMVLLEAAFVAYLPNLLIRNIKDQFITVAGTTQRIKTWKTDQRDY